MTDHDRQAFAKGLYVLCEMFNEPISAVRADGYFEALCDLELVDVNRAVRLALRSSRFFPKPIELRELVIGTPDANADAAWAEVVAEIHRVGYTGTPTFSDERTPRAIRETWGSWLRLCQTLPGEGPELIGWTKQFKGAFRSLDARDTTRRLEPGVMHADVLAFVRSEQKRIGHTNQPMRQERRKTERSRR